MKGKYYRPLLSPRMVELRELLLRTDLGQAEIADKLGLTYNGLKNSLLKRLYIKLGVNSRIQLMRLEIERLKDT